MRKGYWYVRTTAHDPVTYSAYVESIASAIAKFGGRFLVNGGAISQLEGGDEAAPKVALIEFASYSDAISCYRLRDDQAALSDHLTDSRIVVSIEEGEEEKDLSEDL